MSLTVPLQETFNPSKEFVVSSVEKITKQVLAINEGEIGLKIEVENNLKNDFSDLPLLFDNLLLKFKVVSQESFISVDKFIESFNFVSNNKTLKKKLVSIEKNLFKQRLDNKISLQKYLFSKIYLTKLKETSELTNIVLFLFSGKNPEKNLSKAVSFLEKFKMRFEEYNLSFITFFALLFLLQKKELIFEKRIFNKINLYAADLSRKHDSLINDLKDEFK